MDGPDPHDPDSGEQELARRASVLVIPPGTRGLVAEVVLTNDRILYGRQLFAASGGGLATALVERRIQKRYDRQRGGPVELLELATIRAVRIVRRRLRGDLYELDLADGTTAAVGATAIGLWEGEIRRLLRERHGAHIEDEPGGWRVTS